MHWIWYAVIAIIYFSGYGVTIAIFEREFDTAEIGAVLGFLWPIVIPTYLGWKVFQERD